MEQFFTDLLNPVKKNNKDSDKLLDKLYIKPKRDLGGDQTHFDYINEGYEQQADLLFLPNDQGYIYALVVTDQGSRKVDAEPLKSKSSIDILKAFNEIYKRKILKIPKVLTVDDGSEFKGDTKTGLEKLGIQINVAVAGRHRQVGLVERKNQTIGTLVHKLILHDQITSGNSSSSWVGALSTIIKVINNKVSETPKPKQNDQVTSKGEIDLLDENTRVRVMLDNPKSFEGNNLIGKFRLSDIRWNPTIRTIKYVIMKPNQPVMYLLDGDYGQLKVSRVAYTRNQLQVVSDKETKPDKPIMTVEKNRFEVEKLLDRKKEGNTIYYLVKWKGYNKKEATWEKRSELIKDLGKAYLNRFDKTFN